MKVGNQIINGMFEYNDSLEYTEGDIVFYSHAVYAGVRRRIFHVKTNVKGITPVLDSNETYYIDYFKWVYDQGGYDIISKSSIQDVLREMFPGLTSNGWVPENISDPKSINKSGIYNVIGEPVETHAIALIGSNIAYMIVESSSELKYYKGSVESGLIWGDPIMINITEASIVGRYIERLQAMERLLKSRIKELYDQTEAITGNHRSLDSSFMLVEQNV